MVSFTKNPSESSPNLSHVSGGVGAANAEQREDPEASNAGAGAFLNGLRDGILMDIVEYKITYHLFI